MVDKSRTTLNLDAELLRVARRRAADQRTTLTKVIEQALRDLLDAPPNEPVDAWTWPIVHGRGEPVVDVADRAALYEVLDDKRDRGLAR